MFGRGRRPRSGSIYGFIITWLFLSMFFPMYEMGSILLGLGGGLLVAFLIGRAAGLRAGRKEKEQRHEENRQAARKTVDTRVRNVGEQAAQKPVEKKSYGPEVDPIVEEGNKALSEMGRLYLSIKDPEIRSKINEIMRVTDKIVQDAISDPTDIPKIKKFMNYYLLDSLFANQALDIETDIAVMNSMLDREGLSDKKDFVIREETQPQTAVSGGASR